jgi:hypothetical protein
MLLSYLLTVLLLPVPCQYHNEAMGWTTEKSGFHYNKSVINYLINQMNIYPNTYKNKDRELNTIQDILKKQQLPSTNNTVNTKTKLYA